MIIKSYARAIQEQVYPRGDLASSLQVIEEEADRLEKLVQQLLYLNQVDYRQGQGETRETIFLDQLIRDITERLLPKRPEISLTLDLPALIFNGSKEDWRVIAENLLDNHLRHAAAQVEITISEDRVSNELRLKFWNDGSHIDPLIRGQLFHPFATGEGGEYGLGLSIASRIIDHYKGSISIDNEDNGVATVVKWPKQ